VNSKTYLQVSYKSVPQPVTLESGCRLRVTGLALR